MHEYNVDMKSILTVDELEFFNDLVLNEEPFKKTGSSRFFTDHDGEDVDYFITIGTLQKLLQKKLSVYYKIIEAAPKFQEYEQDGEDLISCKYEIEGEMVNVLILGSPELNEKWQFATNKMIDFCKNAEDFEIETLKKSKKIRIAMFRFFKNEYGKNHEG